MIDDIKFPTGDVAWEFELYESFGVQVVVDGFFGDDGDAETAGDKVFDGFLVVDAGGDVKLVFGNADFFKETGGRFAGAAALFTQDDRLFLKDFLKGKAAGIFHFKKIVSDRGNQHQAVLIKFLENELLIIRFHPYKAQVIAAFMHGIDNAAAVALCDNKVNVVVFFAKGRSTSGRI